MTKKSKFFLLFISFGFCLSAIGYQGIQNRLSRSDVRNFLEANASKILKAEVKIGGLRYLPPAGIALQEIRMEPSEGQPAFSIGRIQRLVLSFGLLNLIRRDFYIPSTIRLDSPEIRFGSRQSPFPFLETGSSSSQGIPAQVVIDRGEFRYPWGEQELVLSKVHFKASPDARGQVQVTLAAELGGIARGKVRIRGVTDPGFRHYELNIDLEDVTFLAESHLPLQKLSGNFQVSEKLIRMVGLTSFLHDWEVHGKGSIEDWQSEPRVVLEITRKKGKPAFRLSLEMNLASEKLQGEWSWGGRSYPFQGKVLQEGKKIVFPHLEMPHQYAGKGEIDRSNGDYDFWFERDRRRLRLHSNLNRAEFDTEFQLDHVSIGHLDWVVGGKARFTPLPKRTGESGPRFRGELQTDYLIVELEPLQDFRGSFELSPEEIEAIDFRWNGVFHLGGRILWRGTEPREDLLLRVEGFPLAAIRELGGRPLPQNLSGTLEGRLKLRGEFARPEIQGYFTIKDGTMEKLDFDRAIVQFQGFPPYLRLYDSKIFKGRNTLKMVGVIDLTLQNLFHGIQIRGPDHLVMWKGMSFYWKEGESAIQGEKPLGKKMAMGLEVGAGVSDSQGEEREETHAVLGPKLKF